MSNEEFIKKATYHNLLDDMAFQCECGSASFNYLKSNKLECKRCGLKSEVYEIQSLRNQIAELEADAKRYRTRCKLDADRIAKLEERLTVQYIDLDRLIGALEVLARLGNGTEYGTSEGNMIARQALSYGVPKISEVN